MNWSIIVPIIGVVVALAVFLFGPGILRKSKQKQVPQVPEEKKQIFCGIEENKFRIPSSLTQEMKNISGFDRVLGILSIFIRNDSKVACMNPIITIRPYAKIFGHIVNETSEDKTQIEESIHVTERDYMNDLILKPKRLGPGSFVDLTVWTSSGPSMLAEGRVSFSSDSDFEIKTKVIQYYKNEERFK